MADFNSIAHNLTMVRAQLDRIHSLAVCMQDQIDKDKEPDALLRNLAELIEDIAADVGAIRGLEDSIA